MKESYRFYQNKACEYFPCHPVDDPDSFNCLFCYCPLYLQEKCLGCGKCTRECPREVIRLHARLNPIVVACSNREPGKTARSQCEVSCIGCGVCKKVCPAGTARVEENLSRIDESACLSCGQCAVQCPRGCIRDLRGILTD